MATKIKLERDESKKQSSNTFYADLFDSGMFSDIVFKYGKLHTFNLHTPIITSKSTWFATHCDTKATPPGNQYDVENDGLSIDVLHILKGAKIQHCSNHGATGPCVTATFLTEMFRFCYIRKYPPASWNMSGKYLCMAHVFMYSLSKYFGIEGLSQECAKGFAVAVKTLQDTEAMYAFMINLVYDFHGDEESDLLLHEARNQVGILFGDQILQARALFVANVKQSKLVKMMPKTGRDLLNRSLSLTAFDLSKATKQGSPPEDVTSVLTKTSEGEAALTCAQCIEALHVDPTASKPASNLCDTCKITKSTCATLRLPVDRQRGLTITVWECGGCHLLWNRDGFKRRALSLAQCPCCPSSPDAATQHKEEVTMCCSGCNGVWRAFGFAFQAGFELNDCICCSKVG